MKRILFKSVSVLLALVMLNIPSFALSLKSSANLTSNEIKAASDFDESEVYSAFAELSQLDQYLQTNDNVSYTDVAKVNSDILSNVSASSSLPLTAPASDELALGIPSFLWGCVFGLIGVLVVYLMTDNNKEQTKKALYGCAASAVVSTLLYVLLYAGAAASTY
jgi:Gpi18-like mannosyltransferase